MRPKRQHCGLLGGNGNLARNYSARYIALKTRLGPAFRTVELPKASELFPGPEEDAVLRDLLHHDAQPSNDRLFPVYQVFDS